MPCNEPPHPVGIAAPARGKRPVKIRLCHCRGLGLGVPEQGYACHQRVSADNLARNAHTAKNLRQRSFCRQFLSYLEDDISMVTA